MRISSRIKNDDDNNSELSDISDNSEANIIKDHHPMVTTYAPVSQQLNPSSSDTSQHDLPQTDSANQEEYIDEEYIEPHGMEVDDEDDDDYAEGLASPTRKRKATKTSSRNGSHTNSRSSKQRSIAGFDGMVWDTSYSPERGRRPTRRESAEKGSKAWPVATVKKILKRDCDMIPVSHEAAYAIAQAGEVFLEYLCEQALECARASGYKKEMSYKDFAMAVQRFDTLAFLDDTIPHTLTLQRANDQQRELEERAANNQTSSDGDGVTTESSDNSSGRVEQDNESMIPTSGDTDMMASSDT